MKFIKPTISFKLLLPLFLVVLFFAFAPSAEAATCTWQGDDLTNPTYWNDADNWSCGNIPTSADDVVFADSAELNNIKVYSTIIIDYNKA